MTKARLSSVSTTTAAGDVLLSEGAFDHRWFFRPADQTVHRLPPAPRRAKYQDAAIDERGTLWLGDMLGRRLEVWWSANGRDGWRHIPAPRARRSSTTDFVVGGDSMWVTNYRSRKGTHHTDFIYRMSTARPGTWRTIAVEPSEITYSDDHAALATGEMLLRSSDDWWIVDDNGLRKLDPPGSGPSRFVFFWVDRGRLWVRSGRETPQFSTDAGVTWQSVP